MPIVIGLTGNIACGKSLVGEMLKQRGIKVLDSDEVVHDIYKNDEATREAVRKQFTTLDRKKIAEQVFGDSKTAKAKRKILEEIIHPVVDKKFRDWVRRNNKQKILVNLVPLIFEAGLESRYDFIITVLAPENLQKERLKKRDPELTDIEIEKRINSQMAQSLKAKSSHFVIKNDGSIDDLEDQVEEILNKLNQH